MATRFERLLWSVLCGAALGIAGCGDDDGTAYGPPPDTSADSAEDVGDDAAADPNEEEPYMTDYGPAPSP